jgi:hypothetical protein
MKTQKFDGCPVGSGTFLTGVGLTVFGTTKKHQVEINVVNPYTVNAGCGNEANKANDYGCLGAGSLELVIDGHKVVQMTTLVALSPSTLLACAPVVGLILTLLLSKSEAYGMERSLVERWM